MERKPSKQNPQFCANALLFSLSHSCVKFTSAWSHGAYSVKQSVWVNWNRTNWNVPVWLFFFLLFSFFCILVQSLVIRKRIPVCCRAYLPYRELVPCVFCCLSDLTVVFHHRPMSSFLYVQWTLYDSTSVSYSRGFQVHANETFFFLFFFSFSSPSFLRDGLLRSRPARWKVTRSR